MHDKKARARSSRRRRRRSNSFKRKSVTTRDMSWNFLKQFFLRFVDTENRLRRDTARRRRLNVLFSSGFFFFFTFDSKKLSSTRESHALPAGRRTSDLYSYLILITTDDDVVYARAYYRARSYHNIIIVYISRIAKLKRR